MSFSTTNNFFGLFFKIQSTCLSINYRIAVKASGQKWEEEEEEEENEEENEEEKDDEKSASASSSSEEEDEEED